MKIIVAIDNFKVGGAERVASLIANELSSNHEVHAIIFEDEIRYPLDHRVILHNVSPKNVGKIWKIIIRLINYIQIIHRLKPDTIYSFAYVGIYAALGRLLAFNNHSKLICSERTDPSIEPKSKIVKKFRDWAYAQGDALVCQTPFVVDYFRRKGLNVKYKVISNPVTENLPYWNGKTSKTIISACRLAPQKNLPLMLHAFKRFIDSNPGYKLDIYGEGPERDNLINLATNLGIINDVSFKPFTTNIHEIMANSLAYVSSSNYEGISNSMLEALAIGMPTICTDCPVGGARMFINDNVNGFLVPINNAVALSESIERVIDKHTDLTRISKNAQSIREKIKPSKIVADWLSLIC